MYSELLSPIRAFLHSETPESWLARAVEEVPLLLVDHANCELKAAMTAHSLLRRYCLPKEKRHLLPKLAFYRSLDALPERARVLGKTAVGDSGVSLYGELEESPLVAPLARLIQEELHHFEQVLEIMAQRQLTYGPLSPSRYAKGLFCHVRSHEPAALVDKLIIGAYIEARSCERFACLAPRVDPALQKFYLSLLRSEARHYQDYLALAQAFAREDIGERVAFFGSQEAVLIRSPDPLFRFHSGIPV